MAKQDLINYVETNGKTMSWHELALKFEMRHGEDARAAWRNHSKGFDPTTVRVDPPPARTLNSQARLAKEGYIMGLEDKITRFEEDFQKGTAQVEALVGQEIRTLDELVAKCNIDLTKWQITKWVQNFWNNRYQVKAFLTPKDIKNVFQESFVEFLKSYASPAPRPAQPIASEELDKVFVNQGIAPYHYPKGCLIINKQDLHFDKYDIKGDNNMLGRFNTYKESIDRIVKKAELSYMLSDIVYILGSDQFNCEWTGMTTKGTPQKNMIDYHNGFAAICDHEVSIIMRLAKPGRKLKIIYVPGNHDEYVGWHMVTWLATYFKDSKEIEFDVSPAYRKYMKFGNSAIMFNHGDVIKPHTLAGIFPQEFKQHWSECNYQYIFTGDKHHEMALDINGVMFYQLTQGSNATSSWDSKQGFMAKGFLTAFVISERYGLGDTYHERL